MTVQSLFDEPTYVEEPRAVQEYADILSQVAAEGKPVVVRRNGADLAAVIPVEHLEAVREFLARQEVEKLAAQIDWERAWQPLRPPQEWFNDRDNPFEPEEEPRA
jgi:prevent-host-death family protein